MCLFYSKSSDWDQAHEYSYDSENLTCDALFSLGEKLLRVSFIVLLSFISLALFVSSRLSLMFVISNINNDFEFHNVQQGQHTTVLHKHSVI